MESNLDLASIYRRRFSGPELRRRNAVWRALCRSFFQRFVAADATVVDVGAGYCEFINNIECRHRVAVDAGELTAEFAAPDVEVHRAAATDLRGIPAASADVVFMSNLLEHLPDKRAVQAAVAEVERVLRPGGRFLILQPNVRFAYREYWDFFDHQVPLSDRSLVELLELSGFEVERVIPRFLPYTTKSAVPQHPWLVGLYVRVPLLWRLLGKQAFVAARKRGVAAS